MFVTGLLASVGISHSSFTDDFLDMAQNIGRLRYTDFFFMKFHDKTKDYLEGMDKLYANSEELTHLMLIRSGFNDEEVH